MSTRSSKQKIYTPQGSDGINLASDLGSMIGDLDKRIAHLSLPYFGKNYVYSGAGLSNPSGHNVAVALGVAMIGGQTFDFAASGNLTMTPSVSNRIWLTATIDGNGFITGYTWAVRTDTTVPSNSVLVADIIEGASAPTTMAATYRGVICPSAELGYGETTTSSGSGSVSGTKFAIVGDGVTNFMLEGFSSHISSSSPANSNLEIWDVTNSVKLSQQLQGSSGTEAGGVLPKKRVSAFVGRREYELRASTNAGTPALAADPTFPIYLRAEVV